MTSTKKSAGSHATRIARLGVAGPIKLLLFTLIFIFPLASSAHVNSPDVYFDGYAGKYHLLVTITPPSVVPGIAEIQIRSADSDVQQIKVLPLKMVGVAAELAPTPDAAERSQSDPQLFHGKLWIMTRGSWKIQIQAEGSKGPGELFVPLPAISTYSGKMHTALGALLAALGFVLVAGIVGIVGAATREASLPGGQEPSANERTRGYRREAIACVLLLAALVFGDRWWRADAATNARLNYKVPHITAQLQNGNLLELSLENPNVSEIDRYGVVSADKLVLNDLISDHGHLMHLFLVRMPDMQSFWHLHPHQTAEGHFAVDLPTVPAGRYQIFADIVHRTGFPETQVGEIDLPALAGNALSGDDSGNPDLAPSTTISQLGDGYRMVWERDSSPLKANVPVWFRFRIEDKNGRPATEMESYMGMAGHAAFISTDGEVFAHVHPAGSVSMAAEMMAEGATHDMSAMQSTPKSEVSFPYGFPRSGDYRIFVQVKRAGKIETGSFSAHVN
ncbi:MAG TPA: hypothetical protein VJV96_08135 [Candidatus Angelobacter sp.]|nr:hypothetical protein [Candidatus Angelobacter sp.]